MPIDVVVGGQFGSEGKGKVALWLKRTRGDYAVVIRPGGTNSGHTAFTREGCRMILRQLPAAAIDGDVDVVLPAGSYVDPDILAREIALTGIDPARVHVDRRAHVILPQHREAEERSGLIGSIGSTGSGTGAALMSRLARFGDGALRGVQADEHPEVLPFTCDAAEVLGTALAAGQGVLVEGTQGFGLSLLHGDAWPKATARDTTAAAFLSESGLPPRQVRDVVLVIRATPIRVGGDSGPLAGETSWERVRDTSGSDDDVREYTSVTNRLRRVGRFDPTVVQRAIAANCPTLIALNHLDHVDARLRRSGKITAQAAAFIRNVEEAIGRELDLIGTAPNNLLEAAAADWVRP